MGEWPQTSASVTAAWLDDVLHRSGVLTHSRVCGVTAARLGSDVGLMAEVTRLTVLYERPEEGAPATVIAKFPTANAANLNVARALDFYSREVAFYTRIAQRSPIRTPRLYHADLDGAGRSFVLLLEDLGNARSGDQVAGLDAGQAMAALVALARFHAAWWGKVDSGDLDKLSDRSDVRYGAAVQAAYQGYLPKALGNFRDCYSDYTVGVAEKLASVAARAIREQATHTRSFLHGDYRADNLLFGPDLGTDGVAAVDWQVSGRGGPLYDVGYLCCSSLPSDYRRRHEKDLLRTYHETLIRNGVDGFGFEECWHAYRAAVLCGLFVIVFAAGGMDLGNPRGVAMVRAAARRVDAAVSELQAGDLLPN